MNRASPDDVSYHFVARRVVWSQMLWMAGYSLTTGPFLSYFGQDLGAQGRITALLLIVPELAGVLALATRGMIRRFGGRKSVWVTFTLVARALSLGIPLAAFPAVSRRGIDPLWLMVGSLALSQAAQAISYVAYLAWLADAVDSRRWGRFFAARNVGELCVRLVVPMSAGFLRDWWKSHVASEDLLWAYVVAYGVGTSLLLLSMMPLLAVAERKASNAELGVGSWRRLGETFRNHSMCWLLIHGWWQASANGLTQAAFSKFLHDSLRLELGTTYVLYDMMYAISIPVSWGTGRIADRRGNKRLMISGVLVAGCSLLFWLRATADQWWWLFGAYACFGAFPAVNITGRNLVLKLAPAHDNATPMALFQQISGLLAGFSGLVGGIWLDRLNATGYRFELGPWNLGSFQILFFASFIGRLTAALWLLPIREPPARESPNAQAASGDERPPAVTDAPACEAGTSD